MGLLSIFQRNKHASARPAKPGQGAKPSARQAPLPNPQDPVDAAEATIDLYHDTGEASPGVDQK